MTRLIRTGRLVKNELGLFVPEAALPAADEMPPQMAHFVTYLKHEEIFGRALSEADLVERLAQLSVEDCLMNIALASSMLAAPGPSHTSVQKKIIENLVGGELGEQLQEALERDAPTVAFCEQQLSHLARLAILHADRRPHDDFSNGALRGLWIECMFGVSDLLDDQLNALGDTDATISWELRQTWLNSSVDQFSIDAMNEEIFEELWLEIDGAQRADTDAAFERQTGLKISAYLAIGSAVLVRFNVFGENPDGLPAVEASAYFAPTPLGESEWKPFFGLRSRTVDELAAELVSEQKMLGDTTYGSLTFERFPLCEVTPGTFMPISMGSLKRAITDGIYFIIRDAALAEGREVDFYTKPFGPVFQEYVDRIVRRGSEAAAPGVPVYSDLEYGPPARRVRSSDTIIADAEYPVFIEVVSGPLLIKTATRGDRASFDLDVDRLVLGKAEQLHMNIEKFFERALEIPGADPDTIQRVMPVIVASHGFPHMEMICIELDARLRARGLLVGNRVGGLAIVSAEEIGFCEGFMEQGRSLASLVRGWKSGPLRNVSFKNYLIQLGGGRAPVGAHAKQKFQQAGDRRASFLVGGSNHVRQNSSTG